MIGLLAMGQSYDCTNAYEATSVHVITGPAALLVTRNVQE